MVRDYYAAKQRVQLPQTLSVWGCCLLQVKKSSHDIVLDVKRRMLKALHEREDIACRVRGYHLEGRTKGLVSTFRKVGTVA